MYLKNRFKWILKKLIYRNKNADIKINMNLENIYTYIINILNIVNIWNLYKKIWQIYRPVFN